MDGSSPPPTASSFASSECGQRSLDSYPPTFSVWVSTPTTYGAGAPKSPDPNREDVVLSFLLSFSKPRQSSHQISCYILRDRLRRNPPPGRTDHPRLRPKKC